MPRVTSLLLLGWLTLGSVALAAAPAPSAQQKAKKLYDQGRELYRLARYEEAIAAFEAAYKAKPHPAIFFNLAQCEEKLGRLANAIRDYRRYLTELPKAEDRDRVTVVIANLEDRLAHAPQRLTVNSTPPGAALAIDGAPKGSTPLTVEVPPGSHRLRLSLPGHAAVEREVVTSAERATTVDVALAPVALAAPAPVASKPAKGRTFTWITLAAAAVTAGVGAGFGLAANGDANALRGSLHTQPGEAESLYQGATSKARTANVLYGAAGVLGAAGATLFFVEGSF